MAGLTPGAEQAVLRAASLCLCDTRSGMGGRQDSMARMLMGVDEKQLQGDLSTLCQKVSSLGRERTLGVKRSTPYRRMGATRDISSVWPR